MMFNNILSAAVGFIPFAGDLFVAVIKANSQNALLLTEFLRIRGEEFLKEEAKRAKDAQAGVIGAGTTGADLASQKSWWGRMASSSGKNKGKASAEPATISALEPAQDPDVVKPGAGMAVKGVDDFKTTK